MPQSPPCSSALRGPEATVALPLPSRRRLTQDRRPSVLFPGVRAGAPGGGLFCAVTCLETIRAPPMATSGSFFWVFIWRSFAVTTGFRDTAVSWELLSRFAKLLQQLQTTPPASTNSSHVFGVCFAPLETPLAFCSFFPVTDGAGSPRWDS